MCNSSLILAWLAGLFQKTSLHKTCNKMSAHLMTRDVGLAPCHSWKRFPEGSNSLGPGTLLVGLPALCGTASDHCKTTQASVLEQLSAALTARDQHYCFSGYNRKASSKLDPCFTATAPKISLKVWHQQLCSSVYIMVGANLPPASRMCTVCYCSLIAVLPHQL